MEKRLKVVLGSAMSIAMCATLIAGSTLALFSSRSDVNIAVTSGKVDLTANIDQTSLKLYSYETNSETNEWESTVQSRLDVDGNHLFAADGTASFAENELVLAGMVPGDKAEFEIELNNASTIDVKYQFVVYAITKTPQDEKLFKLLNVTSDAEFIQNAFLDLKSTAWQTWEVDSGTTEKRVQLSVELPSTVVDDSNASDSIQGAACTIVFSVKAVQANAHTDDPSATGYYIYDLEELNAFAEKVNSGTDYAGETVNLMTDINFDETASISARSRVRGAARRTAPIAETADGWEPIGSKADPFCGTFEGNGHTIYHFTAATTNDAQAVGFFGYIQNATVQHLHFVGVNVSASGMGAVAGAVVGQAEGKVSFVDVTVEGTCEAQDEAKVGGLVGKLEGGDETTVTVEGSSFKADEGEGSPSAGKGPTDLVGDQNGTPAKNVTVTDSSVTDENGAGTVWDKAGNEKTIYAVGTFEELATIFDEVADTSTIKIILTADFDTSSIAPNTDRLAYSGQDAMFVAFYFQSFAGEFDGAGHTITLKTNDRSNLSRNDKCGTLFKEIAGGAYIHDLTFSVNSPSSEAWGAGSKLVGGIIATAATAATTEDVITIENVTMTGSANNVRTSFINRCGLVANGPAGTMNFIGCTNDLYLKYGSEDGAGVDGAGEVAAFMDIPNNWTVNFTDCVNKQDIECGTMSRGSNSVGGFVATAGSSKLNFTNCRNEGNISLMHNHNGTSVEANPGIGGFVGRVSGSSTVVFDNCVNLGSMTSRQTRFSLGSAVRGDNRISLGGFVGRVEAGSTVTFLNKNVNGDESGHLEGKGDMCCADFTVGDIRAGGFIGYTAATVSFGGTVINSGEFNAQTQVVDLEEKYLDYQVNIYAGGLIGQSEGNVTFEAGCEYSNLAGAEVGYTLKNPMKAYFGGIVGYVSKGTVTLTEGATGSNFASAFTVTNTGESSPVTTVGSFAGYVYNASAMTEDALNGFTDSGSVGNKIGQTEA